MGSRPILSEFPPVTIDTMLKLLTGRNSVSVCVSKALQDPPDLLTSTTSHILSQKRFFPLIISI